MSINSALCLITPRGKGRQARVGQLCYTQRPTLSKTLCTGSWAILYAQDDMCYAPRQAENVCGQRVTIQHWDFQKGLRLSDCLAGCCLCASWRHSHLPLPTPLLCLLPFFLVLAGQRAVAGVTRLPLAPLEHALNCAGLTASKQPWYLVNEDINHF